MLLAGVEGMCGEYDHFAFVELITWLELHTDYWQMRKIQDKHPGQDLELEQGSRFTLYAWVGRSVGVVLAVLRFL